MDHSTHRPKPKALPSYLTNGPSPLHVSQEVRDNRERQNAFASIKSSMGPKKVPIDLDHEGVRLSSGPHKDPIDQASHRLEEEAARDPRDEASPPTPPAASTRSTSPYTHNPTVDFDGLSWPSEYLQAMEIA